VKTLRSRAVAGTDVPWDVGGIRYEAAPMVVADGVRRQTIAANFIAMSSASFLKWNSRAAA